MCMYDTCDNFATILREKIINKSKKQHRCYECKRMMSAGESYYYEAIISDGKFETIKTCLKCKEARDFLLEKCRGFLYGEVYTDLYDHINVKEWGFKAARYVVSIQRQWKPFKTVV